MTDNLICPTPEERLVEILEKLKWIPKGFPSDPWQAARFWMAHQEQPDEYTEQVESVLNGWKTPYHDRLCSRLRIFLKFKHHHQLFILENAKAAPWRGDDIEFYVKVVDQYIIMRQAIADGKREEYEREAFGKMQETLTGMTA